MSARSSSAAVLMRLRRLGFGLVATAVAVAGIPALLLAGAPSASADTAPSTLTLSTTLRDFLYAGTTVPGAGNPDFQSYSNGYAAGLVEPTLGTDGTPVLHTTGNPRQITSADSFAQWFHDAPGTNITVPQSLTLSQIAANVYQFSDPTYYPLDGLGWDDPSYAPNLQTSHDCNDAQNHNFSFTQQIHATFTYRADQSPTVSITTDDDLWVFVNGHLAIDDGGVHGDVAGQVSLTPTQAAGFGLTDGQTYPLDVFKAERHTCGSTLKITYSGFSPAAPVVTVGGVSNGATYEYGQVPAATCSVTSIDGSPTVIPTLSTPTGGDGTGQQTATCAYTDSWGQTTSKAVTYTITSAAVQGTPPAVTVDVVPTIEATGPTTSVPFTASATDARAAPLTPACTVDGSAATTAQTDLAVGRHTIVCSATDGQGLTGTASATVDVTDTTAPTLPPLPNGTPAFGPAGTVGADYSDPGTATDLVDGTDPVSCTPASGAVTLTAADPSVSVQCTSTDVAGNTSSGTFTLTAHDADAPSLTVPASTTVEATGPNGAAVTYPAPAAEDNVDGTTPVECDHQPGDIYPLGQTSVTCSSSDSAGNSSTATFSVTVVDTTAPVFGPTQNLVVAGPAAGTTVGYDEPVATDSVDGGVPVSCSPASGSPFPQGTTTVACTATDAHGNSASTSFTVTVADRDAPVVTVPQNRTAEATGPDGASVTYPPATALDAVDGPLPATCTPAAGSLFPLGATTVSCTATDSSGNVGTGAFTVTVVDTTAPWITTPGNLTATATSVRGARVTYRAPFARDAVDGTDPVSCVMRTGGKTVVVHSGTTFPPGVSTVACTATDAAHNTRTARFTVTVTYRFGGFAAPVKDDGSSVFSVGSTVPVRFTLAGPSAAITAVPAKLSIVPLTGHAVTCASPQATSFRYTSGYYVIELATCRLGAGAWQLVVDLGDGNPHPVRITLR